MTENRDHDVAIGRFGDLRLKGGVRPVELGFPANGLEPYGRGKFAVQALDDAVDATTLMDGVARRGNKDTEALYSILLAFDGRGVSSQTRVGKVRRRTRSRQGFRADEVRDHGEFSIAKVRANVSTILRLRRVKGRGCDLLHTDPRQRLFCRWLALEVEETRDPNLSPVGQKGVRGQKL